MCSAHHFRKKREGGGALRNSVLEIAGVRSRPLSLLYALRSEGWINAGHVWWGNSATPWTETVLPKIQESFRGADEIQLTHIGGVKDNESAVNTNPPSLFDFLEIPRP